MNIVVIFSQTLFSHELYNFSKITFHMLSNHDKKNDEFHVFSNINFLYPKINSIRKIKTITTTFQRSNRVNPLVAEGKTVTRR